ADLVVVADLAVVDARVPDLAPAADLAAPLSISGGGGCELAAGARPAGAAWALALVALLAFVWRRARAHCGEPGGNRSNRSRVRFRSRSRSRFRFGFGLGLAPRLRPSVHDVGGEHAREHAPGALDLHEHAVGARFGKAVGKVERRRERVRGV